MAHGHAAQIDSIRRIPRPDQPAPSLAWPTIALFCAGAGVWAGSSAAAIAGLWPWPLSTVVNTLAAWSLFTVSHEGAHNNISRVPLVNSWLGRVAMVPWAMVPMFRTYRFVHLQHHRFTNCDDGRDPEHWNQRGPRLGLPLRWLTADLFYVAWYVARMRSRPAGELRDLALAWLATAAAAVALVATGNLVPLVTLWFVPARLTMGLLGWWFDYLPHHGLGHTASEDRFKATRNRVGAEPVLTPLMLYQNYHLVHHLHPLIPFYRYIAVWRRREDEYLESEPALSTAAGRPLTVEEYRELRSMG